MIKELQNMTQHLMHTLQNTNFTELMQNGSDIDNFMTQQLPFDMNSTIMPNMDGWIDSTHAGYAKFWLLSINAKNEQF